MSTSKYDKCFYPLEYLGDKPEFEQLVEVNSDLVNSTVPCNILRGEHDDPKNFQLKAHPFAGPASDVTLRYLRKTDGKGNPTETIRQWQARILNVTVKEVDQIVDDFLQEQILAQLAESERGTG